MKHTLSISRPLSRFLRGGKTNLLIALVMAVGMIAALSIFASGGEVVHPNCPQPVAKWAFNLGWKDSDTYTCKPDYSKHEVDPQPGSVAEKEFAKIRSEKQLAAFIKSDNEVAKKIRAKAKEHLDQNSYNAWVTGDHFQAVQFKKPALIVGASNRDEKGNIETDNNVRRAVKAGDIIFVFVDPTKKKASLQDEASSAVAGLLPQEASAAAKYSPLKVNINPNLNVEIKVSGDCKGDNTRRTGADGSITFPNCTVGNHTVTVDKSVSKDGQQYQASDNSKQANVPNTGSGNVTFTYDKVGGGNGGNGGGAGGGNGGNGGNGGGGQNEARGNITVTVDPSVNVEVKVTGDCKGDNVRRTGNDGSITFQNCTAEKHTVTVDKTITKDGQNYQTKDNAKSVSVKKGNTTKVGFKYAQGGPGGQPGGEDDELTGMVNAAGNIRLDCGNQHAVRIVPRDKQEAGSLKIVKFEDKNGNKKQDADEPRMRNVTFMIKGIGPFVTDRNGEIEIKNLVPDSYTVKEITKGLEAYESTTGLEQKVKIVNNKSATLYYGNKLKAPTGTVKIIKFEDKNGNGTQDAGEGLLQGVVFNVDGYGTYQTNQNGVINVKNVPLGQQVTVTEQTDSLGAATVATDSGDVQASADKDTGAAGAKKANGKKKPNKPKPTKKPKTSPTPGAAATDPIVTESEPTDTGVATDLEEGASYRPTTPTTQTATSANPATPVLFGNQPNVSVQAGALLIGKAIDMNDNRQVEASDKPQAGVTFTVTGPNNYNQTVTTNAQGFAALTGLEPGEYTVTENVPADYTAVSTNPLTVTVTSNQITGAPFLNATCNKPMPSPSPGSTPTPMPSGCPTPPSCTTPGSTPAPGANPTFCPTPAPSKTPAGSITQTFGNLPKTGQAGLILLASFLTAAGLYYGNKYRHGHKAK